MPALLSEANCCGIRRPLIGGGHHSWLFGQRHRPNPRMRRGQGCPAPPGMHCDAPRKPPNIAAFAGQEETLANAPLRLGAFEWSLITLQSMLWGSSYFFIAVVQDQVPALTIVALRGIAASIALIAIVNSLGYRMPATLAEWRHFAFFSIFNTLLPFLLIVWGQSRATGGMAAILNASAPLFGIFLAHIFTHDEKLSGNKLGGIVLGIVGVGILIGSDFALVS